MRVQLNGEEAYFSTGGRKHVEGRPFVIFLHGAGFSHLSFSQQTRAMAYDGYNIIAPDFPGHNLSSGAPLTSIINQAKWALELMSAVKCESAMVVGHSQGGLVALELARLAPERVAAIGFIATAAAIPVNDALIDLADKDHPAAVKAMVDWGHGRDAHMHENAWPGASNIFLGVEVMEQSDPAALLTDLRACNNYKGGMHAAAAIQCPTLCILADSDRMVGLKGGRALAAALGNNECHVLSNSGHMLPTERPRQINAMLRAFLER